MAGQEVAVLGGEHVALGERLRVARRRRAAVASPKSASAEARVPSLPSSRSRCNAPRRTSKPTRSSHSCAASSRRGSLGLDDVVPGRGQGRCGARSPSATRRPVVGEHERDRPRAPSRRPEPG